MPLMVTLVIMTVDGFTATLERENSQEVSVTSALVRKCVGKSDADGTVFATDHQIDVGDFVASPTNASPTTWT